MKKPINKHFLYIFLKRARSRCSKNSIYYHKGIRFKFKSLLEAIEYVEKNLGPPPTSKHSLDRINSEGHYEPNNLRWATSSQQNHNKKRKSKLGIRGVTLRPSGSYTASIKYNYKAYNIGTFKTAKLASLAYEACAQVLYG